jgi:CubicO group peptidase (beta-lactamase class C family)
MDEAIRLIGARAIRAIEERVFPGCVIGIIRRNDQQTILPFGALAYERATPRVVEDTIYDLASITKSIPTASLALLLIGEGKLKLSDRVKNYLPELHNDFGATIEDLLRYRVQGARMSTLNYSTFEEIRTHIFERGFAGLPGESAYTNLPAFLLGIIVERVGGASLPLLAHQYFFEPLHMTDTTFFPSDFARIAPTEMAGDEQEIRGVVHDESARMFAQRRRAVGHAGLFSTAPDLLNFLHWLLADGGPARSHIIEGAQNGLGWAIDEPWREGRYSKKTFSKTGFTGTLIMVDAERDIAFVILSNRTYPHRPADNSAINAFRRDIVDAIFESL